MPCADNTFILASVAGDTINGSSYTDYISGGRVRKALSSFSGLSHLNSAAVCVLADGEHLGTQIVSGGSINLASAYGIVHAGLAYQSDLETLNIEVPLPDGSIQGRKVKVSNVTFRMVNTRGGYIGPNESILYEAFTTANLSSAFELDIPLGVTQKIYNVDLRVPLGASYENGGRIFYRQADPLPVTITAIIPETTIPNPTAGS